MSDMIEIRIDSAKLVAALRRLIASGRDLTPAMRRAAGIMHDAVEENFEEEGRPKWKSLAASTLRQRAKEGSTGKILQRRGNLARSITRHADAESATVGTNLVYAAIHQLGGQAGRGRKVKIPARPYLELTRDDEDTIEKSFAKFLGEAVG
jgi:phage virion morphogenesis protein